MLVVFSLRTDPFTIKFVSNYSRNSKLPQIDSIFHYPFYQEVPTTSNCNRGDCTPQVRDD